MATPMSQKEKPSLRGPRVVVHVSDDLQFLLSQVARHLLCTKKSLHEQIWLAGLRAHLGLTPEDLEDIVVTSLPRGAAADKSARELTSALLGDR